MQLNQPIPPDPGSGQNPYDFILSGNQQAKQRRIFKNNGSKKQRIILIVGGGIALFALFAIIFMLIFSSGGSDNKSTLAIAQSQNEIIRISAIGVSKGRSFQTQAFSQTVNASLTTGQRTTISYLNKHGKKTPSKLLAQAESSATTKNLDSAQQAGRFDDEVMKELKKELTDYQAQVTATSKATNSTSLKALMKQLYDQSVILLKDQDVTNS